MTPTHHNANSNTRVLVLGSSGMLGNALLRYFATSPGITVRGSVRSRVALEFLSKNLHDLVIPNVDVEHLDNLAGVVADFRPDVLINAVGIVKQLAEADDPLSAIPINSLLPHRLARLCEVSGTRLIHFSTDCAFSGSKGMYLESDDSDAKDLYGRSKFLGEVDYPHALTIRTSIIGHELNSAHGLINWFLAQEGTVHGFTKAIFSGLPTVELARVIRDFIIPRPELHGVHHVSSDPINKFELLKLVAETYGKKIEIIPSDRLVIDRSLDSTRFRTLTGYQPPPWPQLVRDMKDFG